jgi:hypothetical protein
VLIIYYISKRITGKKIYIDEKRWGTETPLNATAAQKGITFFQAKIIMSGLWSS